MEIFSNHKKLYTTAGLFFVGLSVAVAILPAISNQNNNAPLPGSEVLSGDALAGKHIFIANGCVACHSQQVRNVGMDNVWGTRPSIAADYAVNERMSWWMNTATLMGTQRTGPDLTNIGNRLPNTDWHLLHLYNPRAVVDASIMPAYPWLFETKATVDEDDKVVNVPEEFLEEKELKVIATPEALQLVSYLQSLRQVPLPDGTQAPEFLYKNKVEAETNAAEESVKAVTLDGAALYAANCQACHQSNGQGLKGAFPPLKASPVVLSDDPEVMIDIIMNGYDAREEYGEMPAIGTLNKLTPEEVAAIINHEKTSWGNNARKITAEEVRKAIVSINDQKENL